MSAPRIVWLRRDLRLSDQAAFRAAAKDGPVIPVFILDDETPKHRRMGGASRWWLHHSLASLDEHLQEKGSRLILRRGKAPEVLAKLAEETGAAAIHALRHYEPWWRNAERALNEALPSGVELVRHDGNYLLPPGSLTTGGGSPYKIYTPFWNALRGEMPPASPMDAPRMLDAPAGWPASEKLADWNLLPTRPDWAKGFSADWVPGEEEGRRRVVDFVDEVGGYDEGRNLPSQELTSRLSPHLHFGEVSPAYVWHRLAEGRRFPEAFLKELAWRDYAQNVILQFPDYGSRSARGDFDHFPWRDFRSAVVRRESDAWTRGRTGYPIVDAGMRQLWITGWMHNRVRMIAASFLVKHLLIDWREGEKWFWDTLVDADYGNNSVNWQWVAGTGVDSNMFSRIMAPLAQSEKFDAAGYIREWVPELAGLSDEEIHDPADRPKAYPEKIIGHREARERALAAYAEMKSRR